MQIFWNYLCPRCGGLKLKPARQYSDPCEIAPWAEHPNEVRVYVTTNLLCQTCFDAERD